MQTSLRMYVYDVCAKLAFLGVRAPNWTYIIGELGSLIRWFERVWLGDWNNWLELWSFMRGADSLNARKSDNEELDSLEGVYLLQLLDPRFCNALADQVIIGRNRVLSGR